MIPGTYNIKVYKGDTYFGPLISLPDLSPFGGPQDLTEATVTAQIKARATSAEAAVSFGVEIVDDLERQLRLTLSPTQTDALAIKRGVWDLHVIDGEWVGTPLRGDVEITEGVTE